MLNDQLALQRYKKIRNQAFSFLVQFFAESENILPTLPYKILCTLLYTYQAVTIPTVSVQNTGYISTTIRQQRLKKLYFADKMTRPGRMVC